MRTDLGWNLDSAVTFLNHGSYGACPEHTMNWRLVLAIVVVLVLFAVAAGAIIIRSFTPTGPAVAAALAIAGMVDSHY